MNNQLVNIDELRKSCKHQMVDLNLDRIGSYAIILPRLSEEMGKNIHKNSLIMALTGRREGPAYRELLTALHNLLFNWPQQAA